MPPVATRKSGRKRNATSKVRAAAEDAAKKQVVLEEAPTPIPTKKGRKKKVPAADKSVSSPPSKVQRVAQIDAALKAIDDKVPVTPLRRSSRSPTKQRPQPNEVNAKETPGPLTGKRSPSTKQAAAPTTPTAKEPPPPARKSPRIERNASVLQGQLELDTNKKQVSRRNLIEERKRRIQRNGRSYIAESSEEEGQLCYSDLPAMVCFWLFPLPHVAYSRYRDVTISSVVVTSQLHPVL